MARPYFTPLDVPTARISRCLSFPDSLEWEALVSGFLAMGTRVENWQQLAGGITPDEAVEACVELLNDFFEAGVCVDMTPIGTTAMWFSDTIPDGWLWLDGQCISQTTYPELFAIFGYVYGGGGDIFCLPTMKGYSPYGAGADVDLGDTGGADSHNLTIAELPSHSHTVTDPGHDHRVQKQSATVNAAVNTATPAARTDNTATPHIMTDANTTGISIGNTGGGSAFSLLHAVRAVNYIIYAGTG